MKTINGKNITKKHIVEVLKTKDVTAIFKLVHLINGGTPSVWDVFSFVREYATSDRLYNAIHETIDSSRRNPYIWDEAKKGFAFNAENQKHIAIQALREELSRERDNYSKRPMMGHTHLYFCSPVYGHSDYNKWQSLPIQGNERFCQLMVSVADKHFNNI